jgi:hypothetical protein
VFNRGITLNPLQVAYIRNATTIEIKADLAGGWWLRWGGHFFHEEDTLEYGPLEIHLQLKVTPSRDCPEFPELLPRSGAYGGIEWDVAGTRLCIRVTPPVRLPWEFRPDGRKVGVWLQHLGQFDDCSFLATLVIVLVPPSSALLGNIREWDTQFCQGGLPTLGKHR